MKKKILALALASVMTLAMSVSVFAANSPGAESSTSTSVAPSVSTSTVVNVPAEALAIGTQQLTAETVAAFATNTTVTSDVAATISPVSTVTAAHAVTVAKTVVNENAYIATVVDLNVPAGTGTATFTLSCPVLAGQKITVLHQKADGIWEVAKLIDVANGAVTFELNSYSPVAVVVDTTAPKTGDIW